MAGQSSIVNNQFIAADGGGGEPVSTDLGQSIAHDFNRGSFFFLAFFCCLFF